MVELEKRLAPALVVALLLAQGVAGEESPYRLVVTPGEDVVTSGRTLRVEFCLSPRQATTAEVCVGLTTGYELFGVRWGTTHFTLSPGSDTMCTCAAPAVLDSRQPLCWSEYIVIEDLGGDELELSGFAMVLEGAHEPGESAESCLKIESETISLFRERAQLAHFVPHAERETAGPGGYETEATGECVMLRGWPGGAPRA